MPALSATITGPTTVGNDVIYAVALDLSAYDAYAVPIIHNRDLLSVRYSAPTDTTDAFPYRTSYPDFCLSGWMPAVNSSVTHDSRRISAYSVTVNAGGYTESITYNRIQITPNRWHQYSSYVLSTLLPNSVEFAPSQNKPFALPANVTSLFSSHMDLDDVNIWSGFGVPLCFYSGNGWSLDWSVTYDIGLRASRPTNGRTSFLYRQSLGRPGVILGSYTGTVYFDGANFREAVSPGSMLPTATWNGYHDRLRVAGVWVVSAGSAAPTPTILYRFYDCLAQQISTANAAVTVAYAGTYTSGSSYDVYVCSLGALPKPSLPAGARYWSRDASATAAHWYDDSNSSFYRFHFIDPRGFASGGIDGCLAPGMVIAP